MVQSLRPTSADIIKPGLFDALIMHLPHLHQLQGLTLTRNNRAALAYSVKQESPDKPCQPDRSVNRDKDRKIRPSSFRRTAQRAARCEEWVNRKDADTDQPEPVIPAHVSGEDSLRTQAVPAGWSLDPEADQLLLAVLPAPQLFS